MLGELKKKKFITRSVFELQKSFSAQNSCPDNFHNIVLNNLLHKRPLTSIFGDGDMKNSCWQLMTAVDSLKQLTADDSCWQPLRHQYHNLQLNDDKYAKFQLNQMINCWVIEEWSDNWGILSQRQRDVESFRYIGLLQGRSQKFQFWIDP